MIHSQQIMRDVQDEASIDNAIEEEIIERQPELFLLLSSMKRIQELIEVNEHQKLVSPAFARWHKRNHDAVMQNVVNGLNEKRFAREDNELAQAGLLTEYANRDWHLSGPYNLFSRSQSDELKDIGRSLSPMFGLVQGELQGTAKIHEAEYPDITITKLGDNDEYIQIFTSQDIKSNDELDSWFNCGTFP